MQLVSNAEFYASAKITKAGKGRLVKVSGGVEVRYTHRSSLVGIARNVDKTITYFLG